MKTYVESIDFFKDKKHTQCEVYVVNTNFAAGSVSAETVLCPYSTPKIRTSAVDGFALKYDEIKKMLCCDEIFFKVVACYDVQKLLDAFITVEIMTGAKVPYGFDVVVKVEDVKLFSNILCNYVVVQNYCLIRNENVKLIGEDFILGFPILFKNFTISINVVLTLCYFGFYYLRIIKKPQIALFATGDEISNCFFPKRFSDMVYLTTTHNTEVVNNVNIPYILNFFKKLGISVDYFGCFSDTVDEFRRAFSIIKAKRRMYSIILSTGAVSKGKRDFIKYVFESSGGITLFHGVKVKPGKPILFGYFKDSFGYFFGLPGNVLATVVGVRFFVFYLVLQLLCIEASFFHISTTQLFGITAKKDFTYFLKTSILLREGKVYIRHHFDQESFKLNNMIYVDSLSIVGNCLSKGFVKTFLLYPNFC